MSRRNTILEMVSAILALAVAAPTLWMGYLRDDWLLLWSKLDPSSAPADATGVFLRPIAELWWAGVVAAGGDHPLVGHLAQGFICVALLAGLWRLGRRLDPSGPTASWLMLIVGCHAALLELRLWAAASNGALALCLAVFALDRWAAGRRRIPILLVLLAAAARLDALLVLLLFPAVDAAGNRHRRWQLLALLLGGVALMLSLRAASSMPQWAPQQAGRALRLLLFPSGPALPSAAQIALAAAGVSAALWLLRGAARNAASALVILATLATAALLPWEFGGRYLPFAVLATALLISGRVTRSGWQPWLLLLWVMANVASGLMGNGARDLLQRSNAESALYRSSRALEKSPTTLWLLKPPAMGWTNSEADAENVVSTARRRSVSVRFVTEMSELPEDAPALEYRDGQWHEVVRPD